ncbi:hypothetical protein COY27_04785 [Candidatus Woesearchaeota archaeon CG_4_10_14_0_2_um_filter_33_13]|nr:MAG: hypothetical protein COY27_04785 [Candidatus Woesearchaeota archaeon CG_4_10_14_0_2_um_filter_33_13]
MKMNVGQLTEQLAQAHRLEDRGQRSRAYGEAYNTAVGLFPELAQASSLNVAEMLDGNYVHPTHSKARDTFAQVFGEVPGLQAAYHSTVVDPLFARRTDGWFDTDPVLKKMYWVNASDTHKGVM